MLTLDSEQIDKYYEKCITYRLEANIEINVRIELIVRADYLESHAYAAKFRAILVSVVGCNCTHVRLLNKALRICALLLRHKF
jgi:hypothetical protein